MLHIGAGLGYYSAIMAHVVGSTGSVVAVEIDERVGGDGAVEPGRTCRRSRVDARRPRLAGRSPKGGGGSFDAILVNAGVTHPQDAWLDALAPGGRLILPLTVDMPGMGTLGKGVIVVIGRSRRWSRLYG